VLIGSRQNPLFEIFKRSGRFFLKIVFVHHIFSPQSSQN
jgi:hypothetical protein